MLPLPRKSRWRPKASLFARLPPTSVILYEGAPSAATATQKGTGDAPSAAPATQNEAAPKSITLRQTSADLYDGAPSAAPATQNEPDVLRVLRMPRKKEPEMLQVLRLQRKTRRRPKASLVARLPPTSMKVLQVLHLPRKTSLRCSKCCACHAKRA